MAKAKKPKKDELYPGDETIPPPAKVGRPATKIDLTQLKVLMRLKPSLEDTASFFAVSPKAIENLLKREFGKTFKDFRDEHFVHTKHSLIRKALNEALQDKTNTPMLQFCLKNICGWRDRIENEINGRLDVVQAPTVIFAVDDDK